MLHQKNASKSHGCVIHHFLPYRDTTSGRSRVYGSTQASDPDAKLGSRRRGQSALLVGFGGNVMAVRMGRGRRGLPNDLAVLPWPLGLAVGVLGFDLIRYGIPAWASGQPLVESRR